MKKIRHAMLDKDWNQADLARALGVNEDWLSRRLLQRTDLSVKELYRIAAALDVKASSLIPDEDVTGWEPRIPVHRVRALPDRRSLLPGERPVRYMAPPLENAA